MSSHFGIDVLDSLADQDPYSNAPAPPEYPSMADYLEDSQVPSNPEEVPIDKPIEPMTIPGEVEVLAELGRSTVAAGGHSAIFDDGYWDYSVEDRTSKPCTLSCTLGPSPLIKGQGCRVHESVQD